MMWKFNICVCLFGILLFTPEWVHSRGAIPRVGKDEKIYNPETLLGPTTPPIMPLSRTSPTTLRPLTRNIPTAERLQVRSGGCHFRLLSNWTKPEECEIGPFRKYVHILEATFDELCPKSVGNFETKKSCDIFVVCTNLTLSLSQCPPGHYFNKYAQACVISKMPCHKLGFTDIKDIFDEISDPGMGNEISARISESKMPDPGNNYFGFGRYSGPPGENVTRSPIRSRVMPPSSAFGFGRRYSPEELRTSNENDLVGAESSKREVSDWRNYNTQRPRTPYNTPRRPTVAAITDRPPEMRYGRPGRTQSQFTQGFGQYQSENQGHGLFADPVTTQRTYVIPTPSWSRSTTHRPQFIFDPTPTPASSSGRGRGYPIPITPKPIIPEVDCKWQSGLFPHPDNCNQFINCGSGMKYVMDCAPGTLFNPDISSCDWPHKVKCHVGSSQTQETYGRRRRKRSSPSNNPQITVFRRPFPQLATYDCPIDSPYRTPFPQDCSRFIECEKSQLFVKACPPGTLFDAELGACDHSYKVQCQKEVPLHDYSSEYSYEEF